ncbi:ribosome maturation factor RimP [Brucepastera parasyntrophica]|uniref:ribosome maturation factor RimP n=1 Tax=Brucepastera parasyntrophica TaxID=2880008 RepID=UPI002108A929|nr:ribosome maturation factor RimP [Brucepastera parasyntrophica]ULQ60127.1 ribosome maturation factor RimP [Brucepastera parasyntrophica]
MEYTAPENMPYFTDCEPLVRGLGYQLLEFTVFKRHTTWQIRAVIYTSEGVGINDCSKVHRILLPRLEALLSTQDLTMEITSPGIDRILKDAYEFSVLTGKNIKIWNTDVSDWIYGEIVSSDQKEVCLLSESGKIQIPYSKIAKARLSDRPPVSDR